MSRDPNARDPADGAEQADLSHSAAQDRLASRHHAPEHRSDEMGREAGFDSGYLHWRAEKGDAYDDDYRRWRGETGQSFSQSFVDWLEHSTKPIGPAGTGLR